MKRLIAGILSFVMTFGGAIPVYAEPDLEVPEEPGITEEYQYTVNVTPTFSITNKKAECKTVVLGISGTATQIDISMILQKKVNGTWYYDSTWYRSFNSWYAMYTTTKSPLSSGTYRLKSVVRVHNGSDYETITVYSTSASC